MVSAESAAEIFNNLKVDPENNQCFECLAPNPTWASVNNGCLICSNCVESYLALGPQISRIKSLDDQWTEDELKLMIAGGNSSLREFFGHYILINTPPNFKFMTRAAFFYREMLAVVSQDREYENNCPGIEEGVELVQNAYPDLGPARNEERKADLPQEESKKTAWDWAKTAYNKTVEVGNKTADKIGQKLNEFAERPNVKKVENKTIEIVGKVETGLNKILDKITSKPAVQETITTVNSAADSFAREAKLTYTKISSNPSVQQMKVDAMNMLKELGNKISGTPAAKVPNP